VFESQFEVDQPSYHDIKTIANDLLCQLDEYKLPQEGKEHLKTMLYATVPGGKMNRGLTVSSALKSILKRDLDPSEVQQANVLGWCVELVIMLIYI